MSIHHHIAPTPQAAAEAAAVLCAALLRDTLAGKEMATLAVSGGSTPALMFDALAREDLDWKRIHVFWVDERNVPPGDPMSNFTMAEKHLLLPAHIPASHVHRIEGERDAGEAARHYAAELRRSFDGTPHFDVLLLGIGPDSHTASLFPGERLIDDREGLAAAVYVEKLGQWRITLLPGVLLAARHILILATGPDKAKALRDILSEPYDPSLRPAQIVAAHDRRIQWFLDEASAAGLE